ncbi:hypothetical protein EVAR_14950_1 [Eumeta japonica]|uniref:Uncharacterized protein n=1 Tax=Eumeta variegata TaxID=151549 RepID=A0A4C1XQA9_EUMVA|nr:hypothetical protein EVAR_14950_1 [Eumeta japonica]
MVDVTSDALVNQNQIKNIFISAWPRLPIKMYATHMCNGCTTYKMQGVVHPTQLLANRHLVKLGLIKSERKKTLSIIDHAATLQEIRRP